MATVQNPLFSMGASGQLAQTLIYRRGGRGFSVYPYFRPTQPQTQAQVSQRNMFRFLTQQWPLLTQAKRATWAAIVDENTPTPHLAYMGYNLKRWQNFQGPTQAYPATEALEPTHFLPFSPIGGQGYIDWRYFPGTEGEDWQVCIWRATAPGITPGPHALSRLLDFIPPPNWTFHDAPLDPAQYWAKFSIFSPDGKWYHRANEMTATAT